MLQSDFGQFKLVGIAPDSSDMGIQMSDDARHYAISAKLDAPFTNQNTDLVIQYTVKHTQDLDCGGAYIKLLGDMDQTTFGGETPYQIMFGPDICGPSNQKTHVILDYPPKKESLLIKEQVKVETDTQSHLYTLHIKADNSFEVFIDQESVRSGKLADEFDFLLPKEVQDPSKSKPEDWVDDEKIVDPEDVKPAGYDDIPAEISDPDSVMPEDWDNEEDGEWEAPLINNPEFKGNWKAKMIDNPAYKGPWVHPMIPNADYMEDKELHVRCKGCTHIGFELWMVKSGTMFDDIIVTDSLEEAKEYAAATFMKKKDAESSTEAAARAASKVRPDKPTTFTSHDEEEDEEEEESGGNDEL